MPHDSKYIVKFALLICLGCSLVVSASAVTLRNRQEANKLLDYKKNVLMATGLMRPGESLGRKEILDRFSTIVPKVIDLSGGDYADLSDEAVQNFVQAEAVTVAPPKNNAGITEVPEQVKIFHAMKDGQVDMIVLPIYGKGLWSTLYGFIALDADTTTVRGITYYQHGETPGLGGEVDNPKWKSLWPGRKVYDDDWDVALEVVKGQAGPPSEAPHKVDGLSGATITSRGVSNMIDFWLGEEGYGPYLENFREQNLDDDRSA